MCDSLGASIDVRVATGFDDPLVSPESWQHWLSRSATDEVFLTPQWQRTWWESFGRGTLLLLVAFRGGSPIALAPLFADAGMVFFVGSGGSDYLDFVGEVHDPDVLKAILQRARNLTPGFEGFLFYHVPAASPTGPLLARVAAQLRMTCYEESSLSAPRLDIAAQPDYAQSAPEKKSLRRHERWFHNRGKLEVRRASTPADIPPHLDTFFDQHIARWRVTETPSLFIDPVQRDFYRRLTISAGRTDWLRFTRIDWNDRPIAFHFGFCYRGSYLWYKPSFDIELAPHSPGEVLLRQLLLAAIAEGARIFDFGLGEEAFKTRFATTNRTVHNWGLYPAET